ncbi:MAG: hypothetical protein L0387_32335 [Acidobacteria bacterium]|nr:hypothetical protein [Acidobacteriota bacterium]MCI0721647.1 hypothetical protein [Acidobacteriota bacterium]
MNKRKAVAESTVFLGLLALAVTLLPSTGALAAEPATRTTANVYWGWDSANPVGTSELIRSSSGITAVFNSSGLPAGQAVTLWFIIFNNPEHCSTTPCTLPADLFAPDVDGDFHFGSGHVVGAGVTTTFAGHLNIGDTSGSGRVEVGLDAGFPLADPYKAEVLLAIHSHGPMLEGQALKSQINSFLGGCQVFLGPNGLAAGPQDVPDQIGECSTLQFSLHRGRLL